MDISNELYGFYRALVVGNKDSEFFGRILVWIPQIMPEIEKTRGILAMPGNNPVGGRNMEGDEEHHYMGTSYIPKKGSWVFVFFEAGNPSNPYYFGACDLKNTTVLPENRLGTNFEDKWVIFKSHEGRTVVVSDDPDDERVEITGKKRLIKEKPTGDEDSVYKIDDNQTTILLDERKGKEKLLIRTYKGDFIHIDIDQRNLQIDFENDINIECRGNFSLKVEGDIDIRSDKNMYTTTKLDTHITAELSIFEHAHVSHHTKAGNSIHELSSTNHQRASTLIARDCDPIHDNDGQAVSANQATPSDPTKPDGQRKT
jgi:hypothetical protein